MRRRLHLANPIPTVGLLLLVGALPLFTATLPAGAIASPHRAASVVRVSADPYANAGAEHATEVEPDTAASGHAVMSVFQVGRWPNGCSDNTGWAYSPDGGRTWKHGFLPGLTKTSHPAGSFDRVSDPTVAYDAAFKVWLASGLDCNKTSASTSAPLDTLSVSVNRSADGLHWGKAVVAGRAAKGQSFDKDWITCDNTPTSKFFGNCYLEWDLLSGGAKVLMSTSRDGGRTWSAPAATASKLLGEAGEPVVQPNGTVVVPIIGLQPSTSLVDFRSTDGGRTWGRTIHITGLSQHIPRGNLRGPTFPSVATDHAGRVYLAWPDCRFRPSCPANDMVMTSSADGVHWGPVVRIPADPVTSSIDHLGGGLGIDPHSAGTHARLGLFYAYYRNAKCTVDTCQMSEAFMSSVDGGAHWSAPRVLAGPMRVTQFADAGGFMTGDYVGAVVLPGGRALATFPVGAPGTGGKKLNEAMYEPSGGAPVTGGSRAASASGAHPARPARSAADGPVTADRPMPN